MAFAVNENAFARCAPAISTNIKQCGSVTQCDAKAITADELSTVYMRSSEFRVMEALFHHDMEIKMCESVQNGLYDFFMANKVSMTKGLTTRRQDAGTLEIAPYVMARQYSPINNEYWAVTHGATVEGEANQWSVRVASTTNIPASTQAFPAGLRVFIQGKSAGGSATRTAWGVVSATLSGGGDYVTLVLQSYNDKSKLMPAHSDKLAAPVTGIMTRGTPNVSDYEKWCNEAPTYLNWKNVPFWVENVRDSFCRSELYAKWRKLVLEDNALYKELFDLPEIERNKQIAADFQKRLVQQMFWGKAGSVYQDLTNYSSLPSITIPTIGPVGTDGATLGVEGGRCVSHRADMIGIYEQHAECGRVLDLQGGVLNIPSLARALYNMYRVRKANGTKNPGVFDCFCDSQFAELVSQGMLAYYNAKSQNTMRLNVNGEGFAIAKKANFGFSYRSFNLFWPQNVTINIITHEFFDDQLTALAASGIEDTGRVFWILDLAGIRPGIIASNRKVNKTGNLNTMAAVSSDAACVMETPWVEWTHYSMLMTMIVDCTYGNLIIENIANTQPGIVDQDVDYDAAASGSATSTTTSTPVL